MKNKSNYKTFPQGDGTALLNYCLESVWLSNSMAWGELVHTS